MPTIKPAYLACLLALGVSAASFADTCIDSSDAGEQTNDNPYCLLDKDNAMVDTDRAMELICGADTASELCQFALNSVNNIFTQGHAPEDELPYNCYSHEHINVKTENTGTTHAPDINVANPSSPYHSRTDCSGWINYALTSVDNINYTHANQAITKYHAAMQDFGTPLSPNWPQAFVYYNFFNELSLNSQGRKTANEKGLTDKEKAITTEVSSDYWKAHQDLSELKSGDILAWCEGERCDPLSKKSQSGNTGHVMIVIAAKEIFPKAGAPLADHIKDLTSKGQHGPDKMSDVKYWSVGVIDSSGSAHGSSFTAEKTFQLSNEEYALELIDNRFYGDLPKKYQPQCHVKGGLGAGVILLAQWHDGEQWRYARAFSHAATAKLQVGVDNKTAAGFAIAFGRVIEP
ncbi:hypothetical protein L1285_04065 [Pseudoalteromonas sp. DL2-H2.2]|uniref:hypothetical protein n=1 Tax=Pseudoalteromonas sp. DL2-H2.2 TaxID=2908889 RepID=UPI001F2A06D9|nr:hypothetical protein [Pseudoalteromonas sp. DL2-H2.2]MCF2907492.1 hypothetical protein [Pseudoalteromonas sp. DL2-H2.2]